MKKKLVFIAGLLVSLSGAACLGKSESCSYVERDVYDLSPADLSTDFTKTYVPFSAVITSSSCDEVSKGDSLESQIEEISRSGNDLMFSDGWDVTTLEISGTSVTWSERIVGCTDDDQNLRVTLKSGVIDDTADTITLTFKGKISGDGCDFDFSTSASRRGGSFEEASGEVQPAHHAPAQEPARPLFWDILVRR